MVFYRGIYDTKERRGLIVKKEKKKKKKNCKRRHKRAIPIHQCDTI